MRRAVTRKGLLPYAFLGSAALALLLFRLGAYPPVWLDEGFSTHAARVLAEFGVYGTYTTDGLVPYNAGVLTTGPTVIVPVALSFLLLGVGVVQARLVIVGYTLLLALGGLYALARCVYGRRAASVVILTLLAAPSVQGVSFLLIGQVVPLSSVGGALCAGHRDRGLPGLSTRVLIG